MTLTELLNLLQSAETDYGDIPVIFYTPDDQLHDLVNP